MKQTEPRVFEYRIKYNADETISAMNSYHYYMACDTDQALSFHNKTMERRQAQGQILSVYWYNPWADRWEDQEYSINKNKQLITRHENS